MTTKSYLFDGVKSVTIGGDDGWQIYPAEEASGTKLYSTVSWVYRCVDLIRNTAGTVPFDVKRGETIVDSSSEYKNLLGWLANPKAFMEQVSAALFLYGQCYYLKKSNRAKFTKELQYLHPSTIECLIDERLGLTGFRRHVGSSTIDYKPDELLYFWLSDPSVEIGPPLAWPMKSIEAPASALSNLTAYADAFFARGAVKVTILSVEGNPPQAEREKLEAWWSKVISGVRNAFSAHVVSANSVNATVIGEGLESLKDNTLSEGAVREIATGAGVPYSLLMSDAANYATARQDMLTFLDTTVVPMVEFVWEVVNKQMLEAQGLMIVPTPESLTAYQEDEAERSKSLVDLVNAGVPLLVAMDGILGYDLTPEAWQVIKDSIASKEKATEQMQEQMQQQPEQPEQEQPDEQVQEEVKRWQRKALRLGVKRMDEIIRFETSVIPAATFDAIRARLQTATDESTIRAAFANYAGAVEPTATSETMALVAEMKRLADFLEATSATPAD
jgi:HK97 family phage portal protein